MTTVVKLAAEPKAPDGRNIQVISHTLQHWMKILDEVKDSLDRAEGRRFLLRILASAAENYIENWNPDQPHFRNTVAYNRKVFFDSPDTDYLRSNLLLKGGRRYRIWGVIPRKTLYMGIQLYRSQGLPGHNLSDENIPRNRRGEFELIVTAEDISTLPPALRQKTILRGHGDETSIICRQYFSDRTREAPIKIYIERLLDAGDVLVTTFGENFLGRGTELARAYMDSTISNTIKAHEAFSQMANGTFMCGDGTQLFPTLDNRYMVAYFDDLVNEQSSDPLDAPAIVIRGKMPKCRYFGICVYNRWLESLDYVRSTTFLKFTNTACRRDGTFEYVVSSVDPGHKNWLDSTGHNRVYVLTRELLPNRDLPEPQWEVQRTTVRAVKGQTERVFQAVKPKL